jgi:choline kinase
MKALILAAGVSSRLRPLTESVPKCLLEIGGGTILGLTIENLIANGIGDIVIVTGYRGDQIRSYVRESFPALDVEFVANERFATTNNSFSLFLTERAASGGDVMLLDSDIVFDSRIVGLLLSSPSRTCLALSRKGVLGDEEIKVEVGPGGNVIRIGKDVPAGDAAGESIGIERLSRTFMASVYRILKRLFRDGKNADLFYEAAFQEAIHAGALMHAVDVGTLECIEVDTAEDLEAARAAHAAVARLRKS